MNLSPLDAACLASVEYVPEQLPGKYRVRVEMNTAYSQALAIPSKKKVVLFDHTFTQNDWALLTEHHDKETDVIVLATDFSRQFMDNEYLRYLKQRELVKLPVRFLIGRIRGCFVQNEVQDLAAVLQRKPWSLSTHVNVDYTTIPEYDVQMYGGNCLCFDNVDMPTCLSAICPHLGHLISPLPYSIIWSTLPHLGHFCLSIAPSCHLYQCLLHRFDKGIDVFLWPCFGSTGSPL